MRRAEESISFCRKMLSNVRSTAIAASWPISFPCGRDGRSEDVLGELELEPESEPSSEVESDVVADLFSLPVGSSQERVQRSNDCLESRKADDEGGSAFNADRQVERALFGDVLDHESALRGGVVV